MKFTTFFISALLLTAFESYACGPFYADIPTPDYFNISSPDKSREQNERAENIRLWQQLTSTRIPARDIEEVVYGDNITLYHYYDWDEPETPSNHTNLFVNYIQNTGDYEIIDFLRAAKSLEKRRKERNSPWYYPGKRSYDDNHDFSDVVEYCKKYNGTRLADRYGLQTVRALFADGNYADCIDYYTAAMDTLPDSNLFKRMARRYVAGCWSRLGNKASADSVFAAAGDIWSITDSVRVETMARLNPNAPALIAYVSYVSDDSARMAAMVPVAERLLRQPGTKFKGDWEHALAYFYGEHADNEAEARRHIKRAQNLPFSSDELRDQARLYRMKYDGKNGNMATLLPDLQWLASKVGVMGSDNNLWRRYTQNIIMWDWIPSLLKRGDHATAILLSNFAENFTRRDSRVTVSDYYYGWRYPEVSLTFPQLRRSSKYFNDYDYAGLSFQLMNSLSSSQLITARNNMLGGGALYAFLRPYARPDADYYNELIGTIALREENYPRAISYLSSVSETYQRTLNVYKVGCLSRDPFSPDRRKINPHNAKLNFARKMRDYKTAMTSAPTADARGLAALMYAMGAYNSTANCWALKYYWQGIPETLFMANTSSAWYYDEDEEDDNAYAFLDKYYFDICDTEKYNADIEAAIAMMTTDEARAQAQYILGNLKTVMKRYPDTAVAKTIRTSCDRWRHWL